MPATFSRVKDWVAEVLTYSDLNAEINNILNNLDPDGIDDFSVNLAEMKLTADPYPASVASLANTLGEEIKRLRYQILSILGGDASFWYEDPPVTLSTLTDIAYGEGLPNSRLESGALTAIDPSGSTNTASIAGGIIFWINGTAYTQVGAISVTGLTTSPASNNTCLVNDTAAADQHSTTYAGEHGTVIPVDTVGSEITSVIGKVHAYKINNGVDTEYFIAEYVNDAVLGTCLTRARRGMFFNTSQAAIPRIAYSNNDTITLCKLAWLFVTTTYTFSVTYNPPIYSLDEPISPAIGDFWFDLSVTNWKTYTSGGWALANATFIGMVVMDGAVAVAARTVDVFSFYGGQNEIDIEITPGSTTEIRQKTLSGKLNIYGQLFNFGYANKTWSTASDLVSGSVANDTTYYVYVKETGDCVLDTVAPHDRKGDLGGYYHPSQTWRCLGYAMTNGSAALLTTTLVSFARGREVSFFHSGLPVNSVGLEGQNPSTNALGVVTWDYSREAVVSKTTTYTATTSDRVILCSTAGGAWSLTLYTAVGNTGRLLTVIKTTSDFSALTLDGDGTETIDGATTRKLSMQWDRVTLVSDGANWVVRDKAYDSNVRTFTPTSNDLSSTAPTYTGAYWRTGWNVGKFMVKAAFSTTTTGTLNALVVMPSGLTIDTTNFTLTNIGSVKCVNAGVDYNPGHLIFTNATTCQPIVYGAGGSYANATGITNVVPFTWNTGDSLEIEFEVPITEWIF